MSDIGLILIIILLTIITVVILIVVINEKSKNSNNGPTSLNSNNKNYKRLVYSEKVRNYVDKRTKEPFISNNPKYVDSNGKYIVRYDDSEKTFNGTKCLFTADDFKFVEEIIDTIFPKEEFLQEFRETKINYIYNCKEGQRRQFISSLIDVRYFFLNDKYTIFPFHLTSDKRSLQVLYYCQTRSIKVIEMPVTKYSSNNRNYLAFFNLDCFDHMCFLYYVLKKYPSDTGLAIHGFASEFFNKDISNLNHDKDFAFEYFYRMLVCKWGEFYPRVDAAAETAARMSGLQGYPPPSEWGSLLAEVTAEMQEKGILKSNYHNFNERQLFFLVKKYYSDAVYQRKEEWLGGLSFDVYIPSLKIAIEYQGGQHYKSVRFYGGKETFDRIKERDLKKKQLCKEHNIRLIEWKYDLPITKSNLDNLIENIQKNP